MTKGAVVRTDIEQIYAGLYLDAYTSLELMVEKLFIGFMIERYASNRFVGPRIVINSDRVAREFVLAGRLYVEWLPYQRTEDRAKLFMKQGLPFSCLDDSDKSQMSRIQIVRNALAPKGGHALKRFDQEIIGQANLMNRERTPEGYLRSQYRASPRMTRYEELISQMGAIATKLCH